MIVEIGRWVLNQACRTARSWQRRMPDGAPFTMSVNLSAHQLTDADIVGDVRRILEETGLDGSLLCLELTESVLMHDIDQVVGSLGTAVAGRAHHHRRLRHGLLVARPPQAVPGGHPQDRPDVRRVSVATSTTPRSSGLLDLPEPEHRLIAEGVETDAQWHSLSQDGCDLGQGYLFGKPHDEKVGTALLEHQWRVDREGEALNRTSSS